MKEQSRYNLYIDTNIYLTFYHFSNDDLVELEKLLALIKSGKIVLYLPEQTRMEIERNRDTKISDALLKMKQQNLPSGFPQMSKSYPEYKEMKKAMLDYKKYRTIILEQILKDAKARDLAADRLIDKLFEISTNIPLNSDIINNARLRFDIGNPPGKDGSYGDAINWESLLLYCEPSEDIIFIGADKDYQSKLDEKEFNSVLLAEWMDRKHSILTYYSQLSDFFKSKLPKINLSNEVKKNQVVQDLVNSPNFASTKSTLSELRGLSDFTPLQINQIVEAAISNYQIFWIKSDYGVGTTIKGIVRGNESIIDRNIFERFQELYQYSYNFEDDLPF